MTDKQKTMIRKWYEFALLQIVAESYLNQTDDLKEALKAGANNIGKAKLDGNGRLPNSTRMTASQADWFIQNYKIEESIGNTASGFSAVLIKENGANGEYTLSFRSTEYQDQINGGDYERDAVGADASLSNYGFAFAQLLDMETFYAQLILDGKIPAGQQINITGYSLGGHLATAFAVLHPDAVFDSGAYLFNSPGIGTIARNFGTMNASTLKAMLETYKKVLNDPEHFGLAPDEPTNTLKPVQWRVRCGRDFRK